MCTTWGEQIVSATPDGNTIFIYRDMLDDHGDLYWSFKTRDGYSKPKKLKGMVNTYSTEDHCTLSPDGRTLYFTSDRSGGYGDMDIYRASLSEDSMWVNVKNLGDSVNTIYDDDAPFMHPDGVTLYFSSRGRTSMGGYDIFRTTMEPDSTFKQSRNMEMHVNSTSDDHYFVLSANGAHGYLSRGDAKGYGKSDILVADNLGVKPSLAVLRGRTTFYGKPVAADVKVTVTSRGNALFNVYHSNAVTGNYLLALPPGQDYLVSYTYWRMPRHTFKLNGLQAGTYTEKTHDVNFKEDTLPASLPVAARKPVVADHPAVTAAAPVKETFVPYNAMQTKTMRYLGQYGDVSKPGLEFRVQLAAVKSANKYIPLPGKKLGRIEKVTFGDGFTRLTAGGAFTTLRKAFEHNKRVARAGQRDAFVIVIYKGKRVQLEDLEKLTGN
jgi:hypothetical protein